MVISLFEYMSTVFLKGISRNILANRVLSCRVTVIDKWSKSQGHVTNTCMPGFSKFHRRQGEATTRHISVDS